MKHMKVLGLAVLAGAALLALGGTASADIATSPMGTTYTGSINAGSEGHVVLDNPIAKIECASSLETKVESHGAGQSIAGIVSSLSFSGCTDDWHVTVVSGGTLYLNQTLASNGEAFSTGMTLEATRFGITCRYATKATTLGQDTSGTPATLEFGLGAWIPFHSGSVFCGAGSTSLTGSYKFNTPGSLFFDRT